MKKLLIVLLAIISLSGQIVKAETPADVEIEIEQLREELTDKYIKYFKISDEIINKKYKEEDIDVTSKYDTDDFKVTLINRLVDISQGDWPVFTWFVRVEVLSDEKQVPSMAVGSIQYETDLYLDWVDMVNKQYFEFKNGEFIESEEPARFVGKGWVGYYAVSCFADIPEAVYSYTNNLSDSFEKYSIVPEEDKE